MTIEFQTIFTELQVLTSKEVQQMAEGDAKGYLNKVMMNKDEAVVRQSLRNAFAEIRNALRAAILNIRELDGNYIVTFSKSYAERDTDEYILRKLTDCAETYVITEWFNGNLAESAFSTEIAALSSALYEMPTYPRVHPAEDDYIHVTYND